MLRCIIVAAFLFRGVAVAQLDFEREPINYSETDPTDPVFQLRQRLKAGKTALVWDAKSGYLAAVLKELKLPVSSQTFVFSKTSLQVSRITPQRPRAVYFSDDVYVGWVQRGDILELSAADPRLGATFYSLSQKKNKRPVMKRETSRCLQCHASTHTRRIPGHIVRSVFPDDTGLPVFRLGTRLSDHTSPLSERFGGWYVTGTHGAQRHMGNVWLPDRNETDELDDEAGANVTELSGLLNTEPYLSPHSDIVALMTLQHQVHVHNMLTTASHSGRLTARDAEVMNRALEREVDYESESTQRRYDSAAERVVKALLLCDEFPLSAAVTGTSDFRAEFETRGPFDDSGRSLRQFDLKQRLFRYPCSFLIYSGAFAALPDAVRGRVLRRFGKILSGRDTSEEFSHLSPADRTAIGQILAATGVKVDFPH